MSGSVSRLSAGSAGQLNVEPAALGHGDVDDRGAAPRLVRSGRFTPACSGTIPCPSLSTRVHPCPTGHSAKSRRTG